MEKNDQKWLEIDLNAFLFTKKRMAFSVIVKLQSCEGLFQAQLRLPPPAHVVVPHPALPRYCSAAVTLVQLRHSAPPSDPVSFCMTYENSRALILELFVFVPHKMSTFIFCCMVGIFFKNYSEILVIKLHHQKSKARGESLSLFSS